jgi:hypothetical protein
VALADTFPRLTNASAKTLKRRPENNVGVEDSDLHVPTELGDAGPYVRKIAGTVMQQLSTLKNQLVPLQATWHDPGFGASSWFEGLELEWRMSAMGLFGDETSGNPGILGDIAHRLDVSWYNYVTTQQTNTKQWMQH